MVKPEEIEGPLGDLSCATIEIGANESMHHLDQRGGPDNGVELVEHQRFERVTGLTQEPFGARQPERSFSVMIPLVLRPRLVDEMIMVPRQYEKISGLVRHHGTEVSINLFGLGKRDYHVIEMVVNGLEQVGEGGAVELCEHMEKQRQFRPHACDRAQFPSRRASL
jgi:hypothetical protein